MIRELNVNTIGEEGKLPPIVQLFIAFKCLDSFVTWKLIRKRQKFGDADV